MSEKIKLSKAGINYRASNIKTLMTEKWQVVLLISLFWAGLFIGSFYINNADGAICEQIKSITEANYSARTAYTGFEAFKSAVTKYGVFLLASCLFGLSGVGYPFVAAVPLLCGISNGIISGYLYGAMGFKGFFYCLVTMYPGLILSLVALILGACESLEMSQNILKILLDKNKLANESTLKRYIYQYLILLGITLAACLLEAVLCHFFITRFAA